MNLILSKEKHGMKSRNASRLFRDTLFTLSNCKLKELFLRAKDVKTKKTEKCFTKVRIDSETMTSAKLHFNFIPFCFFLSSFVEASRKPCSTVVKYAAAIIKLSVQHKSENMKNEIRETFFNIFLANYVFIIPSTDFMYVSPFNRELDKKRLKENLRSCF